MDINVLKTFIAVCEHSGFSAAAEKLGYTQSTVSSQIHQLEKELNTVLFDRFYHRIALTSDGETVLRFARSVVEAEEKLMLELSKQERLDGTIRLAMSSSLCNRYFKNDFLRFKERYPGINLIVTEGGTGRMFDMLQKNEVDLVFTLDRHVYEEDYIICAEREEQVHFVAAADHPIHKKTGLRLKDIYNEEFILTEKNMSYRRLLDRELAGQSLAIHPALEIGSPFQICDIAKDSNYIAFLPDFVTEDYIKSGELKVVEIIDCNIKVWTQILIHKNKWRSRVLSAFIDFYRDLTQA